MSRGPWQRAWTEDGAPSVISDGGPAGSAALPAGRLERLLGRRPEDWSVEDLESAYAQVGGRLVSLMHVGDDGWLKTLDFAPRDAAHLRAILLGGERADGSSLLRGVGIRTEASDILLRPRLDTAFVDPFAPVPTLAVLCGHAGRDGRPLPESPATIVRAAYDRVLAETGVTLHALGEVEYFLGRRSHEEDIYGADDRGYHATAPFVFGEALRRRALVLLAEMGVAVKYGHSEVGYVEAAPSDDGRPGMIWEQHEIELALAPLPRAADAVVLTQWVLRNLAHAEGMLCSFAPILMAGHAGSGMHVHLAPVRDGEQRGGRGADGHLHDEAEWLVGGLVQLGGALMAFGNRSPGSFTRLSQGKEAPNRVTWGEFDRKALVRLPIVVRTDAGEVVTPPTVEFRLPDGSAHPHLLMAGLAQALMLGRTTPYRATLLERTRSGRDAVATPVPTTFSAIADALDAHREVLGAGGVFPPHVLAAVGATLRAGPEG
ncbi:MAG: glutamine synthetase [Deltaproteobacteria bacterium]|nr:MAG: glutamine synthetase [Deltaproteobacteria bacterium]